MKLLASLQQNYSQFEDKFLNATNINNKMIGDCESWMEKAKTQLDEYVENSSEDVHYLPFEMIGSYNNLADESLNKGEHLLEASEKVKGYPSLNGLQQFYNQVRLHFEPNVQSKFSLLGKVIGAE